jgi:glycerol-3-phosphate acyltransferase PlsX
MKIVIDAMGGDYAPKAIVDGVKKACKKHADVNFVLVGDSQKITQILGEKKFDNLEIISTTQVVENNDIPTAVFKQKPDSSLAVAFDLLKNADALISAGSTGAILVGGFTKVGRINGVSRPALSPLLPTKKGGQVLLLDVGANMDCKSINLLHFAIMGSVYMQACYGIKNPRVGLLNVGTEEHKGNALIKEAFELLSNNAAINFVGNIEARDILMGNCDVVVADGFAGNVALKAIEGAVSLAMGEVKRAFGGFKGKLAGIFVFGKLKKSKKKLDYNQYGGSPFLGIKKIVIKSHGSSRSETVLASVDQAVALFNSNFIAKIQGELKLEQSSEQQDDK